MENREIIGFLRSLVGLFIGFLLGGLVAVIAVFAVFGFLLLGTA